MGIFDPSDAPCGIFEGQAGTGTRQMVSFARAAHLVEHRSPVQTSGGEVLTSWVGIGAWVFNAQPAPAGYSRMKQGILIQIHWYLFREQGTVPVQEGDRAYIHGRQIEVTNILPYGAESMELECTHIGR